MKINLYIILNNNVYEKRIKHIVCMVINTCSMQLIAVISWPVLCGRSNWYTVSLRTLFPILQTRRDYNSLPINPNTKCYWEKVQIGARWTTTAHADSDFAMNEISGESEGKKEKHLPMHGPSASHQTTPLTHETQATLATPVPSAVIYHVQVIAMNQKLIFLCWTYITIWRTSERSQAYENSAMKYFPSAPTREPS